jgi:hypothetical protein
MLTRNFALSILLLFALPTVLFGQSFIYAKHKSAMTYIYKIHASEAEQILTDKLPINKANYKLLVDSFPSDSAYQKTLLNGHYIFAKTIRNRLETSLQTFSDVDIQVIDKKKHRNVLIYHVDSDMPVMDAQLFVNGKEVKRTEKLPFFQLDEIEKEDMFKVISANDTAFFKISKERAYHYNEDAKFWQKYFIMRMISPFRNLYINLTDSDMDKWKWSSTRSYMVSDKPLYRVGDTLNYKAFVVTRKGRAINKKLELRIEKYYGSRLSNGFAKMIEPDQKGVYCGYIVISDSMPMDLSLQLRLYDPAKDEYVAGTDFKIEDYQLNDVTYTLEVPDLEETTDSFITLTATDANGNLPLGVRYQVVIENRYAYSLSNEDVFIPKRMWQQAGLITQKEQKIYFPMRIFKGIAGSVKVIVEFRNANNEIQSREAYLYIRNESDARIDIEYVEDSIVVCYKNDNSHSVDTMAQMHYRVNERFYEKQVKLPYVAKVNPLVKEYKFVVGDLWNYSTVHYVGADVDIALRRKKDTVIVRVDNPRKLMLHYQLVEGAKTVIDSKGVLCEYNYVGDASKEYFLYVSYLWAGRMHSLSQGLWIGNKVLNVSLDLPKKVLPGSTHEARIRVTDYKNKPVKGVNLTTYANNGKFGYHYNSIPYFSSYRHLKYNPQRMFSFEYKYSKENDITPEWTQTFSLDTNAYYQFIMPEGGVANFYDSLGYNEKEGFQPFVFNQSASVPIHMLYVNDRLIYYIDADEDEVPKIDLKPGAYKLKIRTYAQEIEFDSLVIKEGCKTYLSLDIDKSNPNVRHVDRDKYLNEKELNDLNKQMLYLKKTAYGSVYFRCFDSKVEYRNHFQWRQDDIRVGPFTPGDFVTYKDRFGIYTFQFDPAYKYSFKDGKIYKDSIVEEEKLTYLNLNENKIYLPSKKKPKKSNQFLIHKTGQIYVEAYRKVEEQDNQGILNLRKHGDLSFLWYKVHSLDAQANDRYGTAEHIPAVKEGMYQLHFFDHNGAVRVLDSVRVLRQGNNYKNYDLSKLPTLDSCNRLLLEENIKKYQLTDLARVDTLRLYVVNRSDAKPIVFAQVRVYYKGHYMGQWTSDIYGMVHMYNMPAAELTFEVFSFGYKPYKLADYTLQQGMDDRLFRLDLDIMADKYVRYGRVLLGEATKDSLGIYNYTWNAGYGESRPLLRTRNYKKANNVNYMDGVMFNATTSQAAYSITLSSSEFEIDNFAMMDEAEVMEDMIVVNEAPLISGMVNFDGNSNFESVDVRDQFRDCAFWIPNLTTDANGEATFTVTFPDDITSWNTYVYAMDFKKHSGKYFTNIKALKPVSSELSTARFLIEGDKSRAVGKIVNVGGAKDSVRVEFSVNDKVTYKTHNNLGQGIILDLKYDAGYQDTLDLKLVMKTDAGFQDGELRRIPVFKKGIEEKTGSIHTLYHDTTLSLKLDKSKSTSVYLYNEGLTPLLKHLEDLHEYPHYCMEQSASKLTGLILQEQIYDALDLDFKYKKEVKQLISSLEKAKNIDSGWGWWPSMQSDYWMTAYVLRALDLANQHGYQVKSTKDTKTFLKDRLFTMNNNPRLFCLLVLAELGEPLEYLKYLSPIEQNSLTKTQRLQAIRIRQLSGNTYSFTQVVKMLELDYMRNNYVSSGVDSWYSSAAKNTLLAYQIIESMSPSTAYLSNIRSFFMNTPEAWYSTIEQAQIAATILPGLIQEYGQPSKAASVVINADNANAISSFPANIELQAGSNELSIAKTGFGKVYVSIYHSSWLQAPPKVDSIMEVQTRFYQNGKKIEHIFAGQAIEMEVELTLKKGASYLMIEVPIPAGCSYGVKDLAMEAHVAHAEYHKDKVYIYINHADAGSHTYRIKLQPRYYGTYTLNPAHAEMMYSPLIFGRNAIRLVEINP